MLVASALDILLTEIRACRICIDNPIGTPLPHPPRPVIRASPTARIAVCGQAPGTRVHASGIPFSDPSGVRLRDWMGIASDVFYDETSVAIVPMGFCFPGLDAKGGDLPPRRECAPAWRARVFEHLPELRLLLLIGGYAQQWHLGRRRGRSLTATVLGWEGLAADGTRPKIYPLPHPSWRNNAWLRDNAWFERDLLPSLKSDVARCLEREDV